MHNQRNGRDISSYVVLQTKCEEIHNRRDHVRLSSHQPLICYCLFIKDKFNQ